VINNQYEAWWKAENPTWDDAGSTLEIPRLTVPKCRNSTAGEWELGGSSGGMGVSVD